MVIAVVAAHEKIIKSFVSQIVKEIDNVEIETYIDPLLALKYLSSHKCDMLFVYSELKHIAITQFLKNVRRCCSNLEIYIISKSNEFILDLRLAGADDVFLESATNSEVIKKIKEVYKN